MRKFVTFLTTGLLALLCCTSIVSAKTNPEVSYKGERKADTTYTVSVMTNGKASNGVTEITFDSEAMVCEEADIVVSKKVDLYSVNIEDGVVKIAYVAKNAMTAGTFITVSFDVTEAYADKEVSAEVSCVSYDKKGNELTTGPRVEDKGPANSGNAGDYEENENQKPEEGKGNSGNNKKPAKKDDKKSDEANPVAEGTVEEVQTEETVQTEQVEQSEQMEQATELEDEEVPLAAMTEETSNTPVLAIVLVVLCAVAAGVVFFVKRKTVE